MRGMIFINLPNPYSHTRPWDLLSVKVEMGIKDKNKNVSGQQIEASV
jgi:hypothetical protein